MFKAVSVGSHNIFNYNILISYCGLPEGILTHPRGLLDTYILARKFLSHASV